MKRIQGLDFLRGIAVLLVLFRHSETDNILTFVGWAGVPMFFVLSGYLISGLFFKKYSERGVVNSRRFLIRRAFKIYPSFYFFIIVSIIVAQFLPYVGFTWQQILSECIFVQNYWAPMWQNTWTLGVEEHFYFSIAIVAWLIYRFAKTTFISKHTGRLIILTYLAFLGIRWGFAIAHMEEAKRYFIATHLYLDSILLGVLAAYTNYRYKEKLTQAMNVYRFPLIVLAAGLVTPTFFFTPGSFLTNSIGMTCLHFGCVLFIWLSIYNERRIKFPGRQRIVDLFSFIGLHSYTIYLWHILIKHLTYPYIENDVLKWTLYFGGSIVIGIGVAYLIEKPFLRLRNKWVP